ncbi:CDKA-1 [Symbiodinium microadriaticum]|nr:CDKA-1 [Symbiodinium microadriaticum]
MPYSDSITIVVGPENDDAMNMLRNGTGDAVFIYADQAALYQCSVVGDATVSFNCSLWDGFGMEYAYVQTGQKGYALNGTTLAMTKPGSMVPSLINGCLAEFMQTKEYYDVCLKNGMVDQCYPNSHFPVGSSTMASYEKPTNELTGDCSTGYCPCGPEPTTTTAAGLTTSGTVALSFGPIAGLLSALIVMPSFDPFRSTTNDVVREAIIPLSREPAVGGGGRAMSSILEGRDVPAMCMVTHNWSNLFLHLIAAIFADALGEKYYADIAASLAAGGAALKQLEERLLERPMCAAKTYWVCAFAVNQHACICDNFGRPPENPDDFREWDSKRRDSWTGELYTPCTCSEPKYYNHDEPALCEMNKFDAMMRHLNRTLPNFSHLVVAGTNFEVFTRAWCIAEIVESGMSDIKQRILIHSEETLDCNYQRLTCIDVRQCQATRPEDKEMILSNIRDFDEFNAALHSAIYGSEGMMTKFADGLSVARRVGHMVRLASNYGWHLGSGTEGRFSGTAGSGFLLGWQNLPYALAGFRKHKEGKASTGNTHYPASSLFCLQK